MFVQTPQQLLSLADSRPERLPVDLTCLSCASLLLVLCVPAANGYLAVVLWPEC